MKRLLPPCKRTLASMTGGELCKKDFKLLLSLGQGSFGKVYKVIHIATGDEYAVKVICKERAKGESMLKQIQTEIEVMSMCEHPNVVRMVTYFENEANIYLVMELGGENLYSHLFKCKKYTEEQARATIHQVLEAINYLHKMTPPVIHRDLKPENILTFAGGIVKLADFGWAGMHNNLRQTFCGTPDYLSPEMILRTGHTEKIDIWAIGILAYELLTGKAPFSPENIKDRFDRLRVMESKILVISFNSRKGK